MNQHKPKMTLNYFKNSVFSLSQQIIVFSSFTVLVGCTGLSGSQPPAPIYSGLAHSANKETLEKIPKSKTKKPKIEQSDVVKVETIEEFKPVVEATEFKAEPIVPFEIPQTPIPQITSKPTSTIPTPTLPTTPSVVLTPPEPPAPPIFKPVESMAGLSPATVALVNTANQSSQSGDLEAAASAIERATRIEPRNGNLLYKLAVIRLRQEKPVLAEDLAKKAALLAEKDNVLKKNSWLLIAHAKEMQHDSAGANEARAKAANF